MMKRPYVMKEAMLWIIDTLAEMEPERANKLIAGWRLHCSPLMIDLIEVAVREKRGNDEMM